MDILRSNMCDEFAKILDCSPSTMEGVCLATGKRTNIHPTVLNRKADAFMYIPKAFSFESMDENGVALCLGEIVILEEEINPFISKLEQHNITITALHNHFLFDSPRLMFIHFEALDHPLFFARRVKDSMGVLTTKEIHADKPGIGGDSLDLTDLAKQFNQMLGGSMLFDSHAGSAMVMIPRKNIKTVILGRNSTSFLTNPEMYAFDSVTKDGMALCSGETMIHETEVNPFLIKLRQHGLIVTAVHNHWLFDRPRAMYIHFEIVEHPLTFAAKVRSAQQALNPSKPKTV